MSPGERLDVVAAARAGDPVVVALRFGVSVATVRRWVRLANEADAAGVPAADALADRKRTGRPPAVWGKPGANDAWRLWRANYMRPEAPTAAGCRRTVERVAVTRGWYVPPAQTFLRRLRADVPAAQVVRAREGRVAALFAYPLQRRTVEGLAPLDWVNADGYKHNLFVLPPDGKGKPFRPVTWAWQDVRTRRILASRSGPTESSDLVRLAFHDLVVNHGVPGGVILDNTRAASNRWFGGPSRRWRRDRGEEPAGILKNLGIRVVHTGVEHEENRKARGHGWAKPVERAFKDLGETIDKHPRAAGAYTGRSPLHKPPNYDPANALEWELFLQVVADGIAQHNAQDGRRTEAAAGRSFDAVWELEIATTQVRQLAQDRAALLLMAVESTRVKRDGTFQLAAGRATGLPQNRYWHEHLANLAGQRIVARFDPQDLHGAVEVFDTKDRWLCRAECLVPVGVDDAKAAKAHNREQRRRQKHLDQAYAAEERIGDLLDEYDDTLPAAAPQESAPRKVVRMTPEQAGRPDTEKRRARRKELEAKRDRGLERMTETG